ncbi:MAG: hypothetical protein Q9M09_04930 [Mariprofundaceae bacterium]|nr:hypothetical protein [Mariprofundaceae bacterium]
MTQNGNSSLRSLFSDSLLGARLSLQAHQHRSEHWVVVSGTATVTRGDKVDVV